MPIIVHIIMYTHNNNYVQIPDQAMVYFAVVMLALCWYTVIVSMDEPVMC